MPNKPPTFTAAGSFYGDSITLAPSAVRTVTGSGPSTTSSEYHTLRLTLDVTAASGTTPSLAVTVETSADGSAWYSMTSAFAAKTTVSSERKSFSSVDRYVRVSWAITGTTPSFTFSVSGEAV